MEEAGLQSDLVLNLVVAFVAAFAGGLIAVRVGLPPIVGYLLAGVVIGPSTPGGSADPAIAAEFAEVGVILLMFGVGLQFSLKELADVGPFAAYAGLVHTAIATALGLSLAVAWGWSLTESLVFGIALSIASTVVVLRALGERDELETAGGRLAIGILLVEDLLTVVILVLLPALADPGSDRPGVISLLPEMSPALEVAASLLQAGLFVGLMMVVGTNLIPRLLSEVVRSGSGELFTLCILALALGVAFSSSELFGASFALGAFLAGIILNESELSHRAGLEALPLRDAFAVLFFVSIGMIFEPEVLVDEPGRVFLVVLVIVVGKAVAAFAIVTAHGFGLAPALTVSAAMSQIGEFSFVLLALGTQLDLIPDDATSLVLAGAVISITLNSFVFRNVDDADRLLQRFPAFARFADRRRTDRPSEIAMRRHLIICGYGNAGASLARAMDGRSLPFVVIEREPAIVERARSAGVTCILGDATREAVLERARIGEARLVVVTFDEQPDCTLAVQAARQLNPNVDIAARGRGQATLMLRHAGANEVVDPDFEVGLELVRHVLHRFGLDAREINALQARWRSEHSTF